MKEKEIQKQIKDYLELSGYQVYRINNTGIWNEKNKCFIFHGSKGVSDIIAISKKLHQILFIETKSKPNKLSKEQLEFLNLVDGIQSVKGILAYSLEDIIIAI